MVEISEPRDRTFVCWFDPNDDPYAVFFRNDQYLETEGGMDRWHNADQYAGRIDRPLTWAELLKEMEGWRGPDELVSNGELPARSGGESGGGRV